MQVKIKKTKEDIKVKKYIQKIGDWKNLNLVHVIAFYLL